MLKQLLDPEKTRLGKFTRKLATTTIGFALNQGLKSIEFKIAYYDSTADPSRPEYNEHCIFAVWHENLAILLPRWRQCPLTLLISQHRDGDYLKETADVFGYNVIRGSSSRGGSEAIRKIKAQSAKSSLAITPDGPRGPRREMTMGAIYLASRLQMPLVPVGVGYDEPYRLNTWDKFAIPKPASRARIVLGPKIRLPRRINRDEMEECRFRTERLLREINDFACTWAGSNIRVMQEKPFVRARRTRELVFDKPNPRTPVLNRPSSSKAA